MNQATELMQALEFDESDLVANRDGLLSRRESERLRAIRQRNVRVGAGLMLILIVASSVALYGAQVQGSLILNFVGVGVTLCNAALVGVGLRGILRLTADASRGTVEALVGPVKHTIRVTGRVPTYLIDIAGERIVVNKPVFLSMRDGERYILYRAPDSRVLLAGERE